MLSLLSRKRGIMVSVSALCGSCKDVHFHLVQVFELVNGLVDRS